MQTKKKCEGEVEIKKKCEGEVQRVFLARKVKISGGTGLAKNAQFWYTKNEKTTYKSQAKNDYFYHLSTRNICSPYSEIP